MKQLEAALWPKTPRKILHVGAVGAYSRKPDIIGLEIDVVGKELKFCVTADNNRITLADIVPLSRFLSDEITAAVLEKIHVEGDRVPCSKGCSACCGPYLVPLSVPEAFRLHRDISATTKHAKDLFWKGCLDASRRILGSVSEEHLPLNTTDLELIGCWYKSLRLTCPFLFNHECLIYEQRPLACREYFIKGSAEACSGRPGIADVVEIPIQMPNVLAQLASELEGTDAESIILPLALVWCEENSGRSSQTWPAAMMVERLFEIVRDTASKKQLSVAEQRRAFLDISKKRRREDRLCRSLSG